MFYRVHASILKQLMYSNELDFDLLEEYLDRVNMEEIYLEILESDKIWLKGIKTLLVINLILCIQNL